MTTLFISDLHLDDTRPAVTTAFLRWLDASARGADALYVLGDLFEAYIGDDDDAPLVAQVADALRGVADSGTPIAFVHGNRDFLIGPTWAERAGARRCAESEVIDLYGTPTLILHGDTLCLGDVGYQAIRTQLRHPDWQRQFLAQPLVVRRAFAAQARAESAKHTGAMDAAIMDVTPEAVERSLAAAGVRRMIHGHTHRPAIHRLPNGCERIVLGDWYTQGSVLRVTPTATVLETLPIPA